MPSMAFAAGRQIRNSNDPPPQRPPYSDSPLIKKLVSGPEEAAASLRVDREGGREAERRARQVRRL